MIYNKLYHLLKGKPIYADEIIPVDEKSEIRNYKFNSLAYTMLSGNELYSCKIHDKSFICSDLRNTGIEGIDKIQSSVLSFRTSLFASGGGGLTFLKIH